jgi:hypothetical protein
MAGIDIVTDRLPGKMRRDGEQLKVMFFQEFAARGAVCVVGLVDLEVIAPARQFQTVIPKADGLLAHRFDAKIGPLSSKEGYGSRHLSCSPEMWMGASAGS